MLSGFTKYDYLTGGTIAIVAILMVFLILLIIILLTEAIAKLLNHSVLEEVKEEKVVAKENTKLDLNDEDAIVACLVASIDYRSKTKNNIRVVSVREVK